MFIKQVDSSFDSFDDAVTLLNGSGLEKMAEADERVRNFVRDYLKEHKQPGKFYIHINAMGAGEYYGSNRNGDYFPEDNLLRYVHTFENGHLFRHHQNKDPERAHGKVLKAFYNERMHRIELIVEADKTLAADVEERIDNGDMPWTSMATKTPYDTCSVCGNHATSLMEYCDHLSNQMNAILSDGKKVFAINDGPLRFFDISIVVKPADPTSGILEKVAGQGALPHTPLEDPEYRLRESEMPLQALAHEKRKEMLRSRSSFPPMDIAYPPEHILPTLRGCTLEELSNAFADSGVFPPLDYTMRILDPKLDPKMAAVGAGLLPLQNGYLGMAPLEPNIGFLKTSEDLSSYIQREAYYCKTDDSTLEKRAFYQSGINPETGYLPLFAQNPFAPPVFYPAPSAASPDGNGSQQQSQQKQGLVPYLVGLAGMAMLVSTFAHALASHKGRESESDMALLLQSKKIQEQQQEILDHLRHPRMDKEALFTGGLIDSLPIPPELKEGLETFHRANELKEDLTSDSQGSEDISKAAALASDFIGGGERMLKENPVLAAEAKPYSITPPAAAAAAQGGSIGAGQGFSFGPGNGQRNPVSADLLGEKKASVFTRLTYS